jgi:hypothetical protein
MTDKQRDIILEMLEFSDYPLSPINLETATKEEASEWIEKNIKIAHESTSKFAFY